MKEDKTQLTVRDLIEMLQNVPNLDARVQVEGCDCTGEAFGIEISSDSVLITR